VSLAPVSTRVRSRAALAVGACAVVLAGCTQTGFEAQTNASYDPGVGTNEAFGEVAVLNVLVVDNGDQTGVLSATLTRRFDEQVQLTGVTAMGLEGERLDVGFGEPLDVPANTQASPLLLGSAQSPIVVSGEPVQAGRFIRMSFEFSNGNTVSLDAPVVGRSEEGGDPYTDIPTGSPTASPTAE